MVGFDHGGQGDCQLAVLGQSPLVWSDGLDQLGRLGRAVQCTGQGALFEVEADRVRAHHTSPGTVTCGVAGFRSVSLHWPWSSKRVA